MTHVVSDAQAPARQREFCLAGREKIPPPAGGVPTASLPYLYVSPGIGPCTCHDNAGVIL
ncbi:hypothetical protein [Streptomyces sp. NPDC096311]|uniref:hypothetical protein n=1 Tax=Streptomyces sp. NPDC096311 TaxID=3366083 RepID=UPI0037F6223A